MRSMYDDKTVFKTYIENASEKDEFLNRLTERFKDTENKFKNILDLGCHNGSLLLKIIERNPHKFLKNAKVYCVDPSAVALDEFKSRSLSYNLEFLFFPTTMEQFFKTNEASFDWIICSHSLYWTKNLTKVIKEIVSRGHQIVIVLRGDKGIYEIQSSFKNLLGSEKENLYTSDDIDKKLRKLSICFSREDIKTTINVPPFDSPEFRSLIAFFLQTNTGFLNNSDYERIFEFIEKRGNPFSHNVSFFWINRK